MWINCSGFTFLRQLYIPVSRHRFKQLFQPFCGKWDMTSKPANSMEPLNHLTIWLQTGKNRLQGMKLCTVWTKNRTRRECEFVSVRQSGRRDAVWASFRTISTHGSTCLNTHNGPNQHHLRGFCPMQGLCWETLSVLAHWTLNSIQKVATHLHTWGWRWLPINSFHFSNSGGEIFVSPDSLLLNSQLFWV